MNYRFFSRRNGWVGSDKIAKYFYSEIISDKNNLTKELVDKSGKEIIEIIKNNKSFEDLESIEILKKVSKSYSNWYYYPADTKITDARIYI